MGGLILGVNSLYRLINFFKLFPMVGKGLTLTNLCEENIGKRLTLYQPKTAFHKPIYGEFNSVLARC